MKGLKKTVAMLLSVCLVIVGINYSPIAKGAVTLTNVANGRGNYTFMTSNANNGSEGFCYIGNGFSAINATNENLGSGNNMLGTTATTDEVAIYIDLGASYDINSALIYQGSTNNNYFDSYCTNYSIYYSTEQVSASNEGNITWNLAGTCTNGTIYSGAKVLNAENVSSTGDAIDFGATYNARSVKVVFDKESCMGTGVSGGGTGTTGTVSLLSVRIYAVSEEEETTTGSSSGGTVTPPATGETTDILFIGNSMTYYNELQDIFEAFANFMGKNVNTKAATNGGQNLIYQSTASNVVSAIDDGGYEVVIIQDIVSSFNANNLLTGAKAIIEVIKQYNPNAKILFYEPWPRETALLGTASRLNEFTQGYINAARETGGVLAPAGEAFYEGYVANGYNYYADGLHPVPMGSYTSAVTIYYALYADEALRTFTQDDLASLNAAVNVAQSNKVDYTLDEFNNITASGYKYARAVAPAVADTTGNTTYTSAFYTIEDPSKKVQADLSAYSEIDLSNSSVIDVSSSVNTTNTGDKIIDKNYGSRWETEYSDPQYFTIALDKTYTLNGMKIYWETAASKQYVIQTSTDNTNWTTVFEQKVGNAGSGYGDDKLSSGLESIEFDTVTDANYIRLYSTARTTGYGVSIFEARLFGTESEQQITPDVPEVEPGVVVSDDIKVEGYQISDISQGSRVVGSVEPTINGLDVESWGFVYAIEEAGENTFSVSDEEIVVGSENKYVEAFESTPIGTSGAVFGDSTTATYFVRTMLFSEKNAVEFNAKYKVRAYALLSDGSYVYSEVKTYRVVNIAKYLYANKKMSNYSGHEYLYNNIITVVDPTYAEVDYAWGNVIAKPEEVDE